MRGAGLRIETMRFTLLVVLTVALVSVAFRINSHHTSSSANAPSGPTASPSTQTSTPSQVTPSGTASPVPSSVPHKTGGAGHPATGGAGGGQRAGSGPATLPVTGWNETVRLGGLAFLLIGAGALAIRAGAPRRPPPSTVQPTVHD